MGLRWNLEQAEIYHMLEAGASTREIKAKGFKKSLIDKVRAAKARGDASASPTPAQQESPPGEPLYSATLKTTKVTLDPIVAIRYDSARHALGWGDDYTLPQFIDEATDIVTEIVGAVPPGFTKEEEPKVPKTKKEKEMVAVAAVEPGIEAGGAGRSR